MTFQPEKQMTSRGCDKDLSIHSAFTLLLLVEPVFTHSTMTSNLPLNQLKISKECLKVPMSQTLIVHGKLKTKTKGENGKHSQP